MLSLKTFKAHNLVGFIFTMILTSNGKNTSILKAYISTVHCEHSKKGAYVSNI